MDLVIDANVVVGYFKETVLAQDSGLTSCPASVFDQLGALHVAYLDQQGNIHHEWRAHVQHEWFDAWYPELLMNDKVREIQVNPDPAEEKRLRMCGFPARGRDVWYIRTCRAIVVREGRVCLLTEDLDFYDPHEKRNKNRDRRRRFFLQSDGVIASQLRREHIYVSCVATVNSNGQLP